MKFLVLSFAACATLVSPLSHGRPLNWDDQPGLNYDPRSTAEAPCGTGTPPRGHFSDSVDANAADGVALTVRQDPNRLCYVSNGIADAPVIRVRRGTELKVTLRNEITDPAAIATHLPGGTLDQPNPAVPAQAGFFPVTGGTHHAVTGTTNLHVHGFAVPASIPQDEVMKTCIDPAVGSALCGQREFTYRYRIPADMPEGLYWYHPHVHGEVQAQMLMGLSGPIVVEGPESDARRAAGIEERVFIVRQGEDSDAKYAAAIAALPLPYGSFPDPNAKPPVHRKPPVKGESVDTNNELACLSNAGTDVISLNGSKVIDGRVKDLDLAHVEIAAGSSQFWRVINAATDAFLNLTIIDQNGNPVALRIVARDGAPLTDDHGNRLHPAPTIDAQLIPPSGRLEFMVPAPPEGQKAYLISRQVDTGCSGDNVPGRKLAILTGGAPSSAHQVAAQQIEAPITKSPDLFSGLLAAPVTATRTLAFAEYPRPGSDDQTDFYIFEKKPGAALRPFHMDGEPTLTVKAGTAEEWVIENWTRELHAFHIHQLHFRVLEVNGLRPPDPPLLDVVNVPFATGFDTAGAPVAPGRVRIKLSFPDALAGDILFHCHLVDHEDNGMMGIVRVIPKDGNPIRKAEVSLGQRSLAALLANPPICRPASPDGTSPVESAKAN
jgi:FtsP/CotA-like multicopper oxidase with cupredoxin domain